MKKRQTYRSITKKNKQPILGTVLPSRVLKNGISKTNGSKQLVTNVNSSHEAWADAEMTQACNSVLYKNMSITEAADKFHLPFSKLCFRVRQERNLVAQNKATSSSTQATNILNTTSEYEDIADVSNSSTDSIKQTTAESVSEDMSDEMSEEDEEVKRIMVNLSNNKPILVVARKSTSPMKLPSYLKNGFAEPNTNNKKRSMNLIA